MLCPLPAPQDSGKGHLSRIVPSPSSSSWPGMQHTLQDYCKTCPASNPFSSCLALVLTAGSCVRPGVRLASRNTRARRRLQPLWLTAVCRRHGKTQAAPHLHISRHMGLEVPSFCQQRRCPAGTAPVLRAAETPDLCQTDTRSLGDQGPNSDHPYGFPGLLLGCHAKGTLQGKSGCKHAAHQPCCGHTVCTVTPSHSKHPADRSQSHHDQPCSDSLPVRTPAWGPGHFSLHNLDITERFLAKSTSCLDFIVSYFACFRMLFAKLCFGTYGTLPHKQAGPGELEWLLPQPASSNQTHGVKV